MDNATDTARIAELEAVLRKLEAWFDTDAEILASMNTDEAADHARQHGMIRAALRMKTATDLRIQELESVLAKLEAWFDTDAEILASMSMDEAADHARQHGMIRAALRMK